MMVPETLDISVHFRASASHSFATLRAGRCSCAHTSVGVFLLKHDSIYKAPCAGMVEVIRHPRRHVMA